MHALRKWDVWGMGLHWWCVTFVLIVLCTVCAWSQVPSGHNQGAAAEADTIREQQLKRTQSVWSGHARLLLSRGATAWGCWCITAGGYTRLMQTGWTSKTSEAYVCSDDRTVMQMEVRTCHTSVLWELQAPDTYVGEWGGSSWSERSKQSHLYTLLRSDSTELMVGSKQIKDLEALASLLSSSQSSKRWPTIQTNSKATRP